MNATSRRGLYWLTALLVGGSVVLQCWLLGVRWIDPDEGAHLMDVRLAMTGLVPGVHYDSRQPLYVYAYVPFFRLFGESYLTGRVMALLATLLGGLVLYGIGKRLWGRAVGVAAGVLFLCTPTIVINSTIAKTEPLAILLTALGMYGLIVHLQGGAWRPLWLTGVAFGAGYYVRESTLAGLLAASLVILLHAREGWGRCLRRLGVLSLGYGTVLALVLAFYARYLPLGQLLTEEGFFPFQKIFAALGQIAGWWVSASPTGGADVVNEAIRTSAQPWDDTVDRLVDVARLNVHFLAGAAAAGGMWWAVRRRQRATRREHMGLAVAFLWLASVSMLYGYYILHRGFFQSYFREFLPPLALLTAWTLLQVFRRWDVRLPPTPSLLVVALASAGVFVMERHGWRVGTVVALLAIGAIGWAVFRSALSARRARTRYLLGYALFMALFIILRFTPLAGGPHPGIGMGSLVLGAGLVVGLLRFIMGRWEGVAAIRFATVAALGVAPMLTASYGGRVLTLAYDCDWSPATVRAAAEVLKAVAAPNDESLSGSMIWELESGRSPFGRITHPLGFIDGMSSETARDIAQRLREQPPGTVILEHYTKESYLKRIPELAPLLASSYQRIWEDARSRYPVAIYVLRDATAMDAVEHRRGAWNTTAPRSTRGLP